MNALDLFIVVLAVSAAIGGYRLGFVARSSSWIGMAIGLFLGARLLPWVLDHAGHLNQTQLLFVAAAVLIGGAFVGQAAGLLVGARLHVVIPPGPARQVDRGGGAAAGLLGVLIAVWLLLPAMANIPDWPAREARESTIAQAIHDLFPKAPDTLATLRQLIGPDRFPEVLGALEAAPDLGPPPSAVAIPQEVTDRVARSTVKVEGEACSRIQDGSGSVIGPDLIETNAHVVAGEPHTTVIRYPDGARIAATVVAFDPNRDVAILHAPGLDRPALQIGDTKVRGQGAVFGHPLGGALRAAPFEVAQRVDANGTDIYDGHRYEREVFFLRAALRPGDSGAPMVDPAGTVVGIAFAIAPDKPNVSYALTTKELNDVLGGDLSHPVSTGPCIS
jgi:S1-C subfamily serine protease